MKERSSVSISFRTLEFASNICPPTNAKEGKVGNGRRGVGVVGAPRRRSDGIVRVARCRRGLAVADSIRFATIFGVARTDGPRGPRHESRLGPGAGGAVIDRVKMKRCHCHVILIGHSITHYFTGVSQTVEKYQIAHHHRLRKRNEELRVNWSLLQECATSVVASKKVATEVRNAPRLPLIGNVPSAFASGAVPWRP